MKVKIQILIQQPFFFSFSLKESNSKKEMSTYPILSWSLKQGHITLKSAHHWCDDLLFLVRLLRHVLRVRVLRTKFVNTITFEEMHLGTPNLHEVYILGKSWISFFRQWAWLTYFWGHGGHRHVPKWHVDTITSNKMQLETPNLHQVWPSMHLR